ncbi:MAG: hypothetical protein ABSB88_12915 [Bryobacteraceae bacterium]|jgi:hypothetical protein
MNIHPLSGTNSPYLQSLLTSALSGATSTSGSTGSTGGVSFGNPQDSNQLSPFALLLSTLQQLQQSNPTEYQQVTQQIATNLQSAAKTATADGNTAAATQLNQLATDFTTASQSGQLPNVQDVSQAVSGGHHHHGHHGHHGGASSLDSASSSSSSDSTTGTSSSSSSNFTTDLLAQFLSSSGAGLSNRNNALNPMAIIMNTLSNAGLTTNS